MSGTDGKPFKKISEIEYEIQLGGRTKPISVTFGKTSLIFAAFISAGGVINPQTGEVQNDLMSLIQSFKSVGDILLTEFDDDGKVIAEGNCEVLGTTDVIALFSLASEVVSNFILGLTAMKVMQETPSPQSESEENPKTTKKD